MDMGKKCLKKSLEGINSKELSEIVKPNFHLTDYNLIGGLTSPISNGYWKSLPTVKKIKPL
jgi:hypothetical protein